MKGVEAQPLLRGPARDADGAAIPDARNLTDRRPDGPRGRGDHDGLAGLGLADLEKPEIGRQSVHAKDAQRGRQRQIAIGDRPDHHLRIDGGVILPAELAGDVRPLAKPRVARRLDPAGGVRPHHVADANRL